MDGLNRERLVGLLALFDISQSDLGRVAGVSKCFVSRLLSGKDRDLDVGKVYRAIESRLPELISRRRSTFFDLEGSQIGKIEDVLSVKNGRGMKRVV